MYVFIKTHTSIETSYLESMTAEQFQEFYADVSETYRQKHKDQALTQFAVADYTMMKSREYTKMSGKKVVADKNAAKAAFKKADKLRTRLTGEQLKSETNNKSFIADMLGDVDIVYQAKSKEDYENYIKNL